MKIQIITREKILQVLSHLAHTCEHYMLEGEMLAFGI